MAALLLAIFAVLWVPAAGEGPSPPEGSQGPAMISSPQNGSIQYVQTGIEFTSELLNSSTFGEPVEFSWDFGDGNGSTDVTPIHAYSKEGNYTVVLTITDVRGNVTTASVGLIVVYPPLPQVTIVAGSGVPTNFSAGKPIRFSATGILMGPETSQLTYIWDFGDGKVLDGEAPEHSYARPGTYNVTVTVSDGHSYSRDSIQVLVKARPMDTDSGTLYIWLGISLILLIGFAAFFGGTEAGLLMLMPLLLLLYSKIKKEQILDNYTRGQIHGYIIANPGDHYSSIKNALDLNNGTLAYHLKRLEVEDIIRSRMDGLLRRYYPAGMKMPEPNGNALTEVQRTLMAKIKETPGISQSDIATLMKLSNATVNYHMERLLKKGVVRRQRAGMKYKCYLTEDANGAFVEHDPPPSVGNN